MLRNVVMILFVVYYVDFVCRILINKYSFVNGLIVLYV